jgi:hypothetical protein
MQPAAPEIERKRRIGNRIGPATDPASNFKDGERDPRRCKLRGGADSGGARTDDHDFEIVFSAARHECSFRLVRHANFKTRYARAERAHATHVKPLRRRADPVMKPDCCPA